MSDSFSVLAFGNGRGGRESGGSDDGSAWVVVVELRSGDAGARVVEKGVGAVGGGR